LSLAFDKVPIIHFVDVDQYIQDDSTNNQKIYNQGFRPIQYHITYNSSMEETLRKYVQQANSIAEQAPYPLGN